jgi:hypothetical protein
MRHLLVAAALIISATAFAQDNSIELLRRDLKADKASLMSANLPMTDAQADIFNPIYREYDLELSKLGDRRLALLKKYAANEDKLDDKMAGDMVKESFSIANDRNELLEKYYKKMAKALGVPMAARFVQVENQMLTLIDAQIIDQVPLVKVPKSTGEPKK